jgi:hypothetical protein
MQTVKTSWRACDVLSLAGLWLSATLCLPAWAGRPCEATPPTVDSVTRGLTLAERTVQQLDATGASVVAIARVGQDLSRYNVRYSHMGWAYKDGDAWRVLHKLNQCGTDRSGVYRQGIGDFYLDAPHEYVAGIVVPRPDVQARLLPRLKDTAITAALHTRRYSMLSYPWAHRYQQSNQWAMEILASAMDERATDRAGAQRWLKQAGYQPTELHLSALQRLGGRMTRANVSFDDHPPELRFTGRIRTVTVDSVFAWLQRSGTGGETLTIR